MPPRRQLQLQSAKSDDPSSSQSRMKTRASANEVRKEVVCYHHSDMLLHRHDNELFEVPGRVTAILKKLKKNKLYFRCEWVHVNRANTVDLTRVHNLDYIERIRGLQSSTQTKIDNFAHKFSSIELCDKSYLAAELAAGAVVQASLDVGTGKYTRALCVVRPPGHHALHDQPMGFCIYNNIAVAAKVLLERTSITRILIVDWDIHHGNGTQRVFWKDKRVLYFSIHRSDKGFYPWNADANLYPKEDQGTINNIGEEEGTGYTVNVPWDKKGYGDADYLAVWDHILVPITKSFKPEIILVSAGFDSAKGDKMGKCKVTPYGYYRMTKKLMESGNGKILLALEGGYNPKAVADSTTACLKALLRDDYSSSKELLVSEANDPFESTWHIIEQVREELKPHWPTLASKIPKENAIQKKAIVSSKSQSVQGSCVEPVSLPKEFKRKPINVKHSHGFPVKIRRMLRKGKYAKRYDKSATHYCAAAIEYLLGEILSLAGDEAKDERVKRIQPRHVKLAVQKDEELFKFLKEVIFPFTGIP